MCVYQVKQIVVHVIQYVCSHFACKTSVVKLLCVRKSALEVGRQHYLESGRHAQRYFLVPEANIKIVH